MVVTKLLRRSEKRFKYHESDEIGFYLNLSKCEFLLGPCKRLVRYSRSSACDPTLWELILRVVLALEVVDEHLLHRLVVGPQHVSDSVAAHQVAYLFGQILGMIAGAFQRLGHE